jgi:hypothetical protein
MMSLTRGIDRKKTVRVFLSKVESCLERSGSKYCSGYDVVWLNICRRRARNLKILMRMDFLWRLLLLLNICDQPQ